MSDDQELSENTTDNIDDVIVIYNNQNSSKDNLRISSNLNSITQIETLMNWLDFSR